MRGTEPRRCRIHLGTSSAAYVAGRDVQDIARKLAGLAEFEPVRVEDVLTEHLALAGEARHWRDTLRDMVSQLSSVGYSSEKSGEQVRAEVRLYTEALDRLDRVLTNIGKLDIDRRMAAIGEQQSERLRAILVVALGALGLKLDDARVSEAIRLGVAQTEPRLALRGAR